MNAYTKPLPVLTDANQPFWEAARREAVCVQRCTSCEALRFPAARYCPACHEEQFEWIEVEGAGEVECFCIFHRAYFAAFEPELPYNVALVRLDAGPRLFTNIVGTPNEQLRIGMRVRAVFEKVTDDVVLLKFAEVDRDAPRPLPPSMAET